MFYSEAMLKNHARICETEYLRTKSKVLKRQRVENKRKGERFYDLVPEEQKTKKIGVECLSIIQSKSDTGIFPEALLIT